MNQPKPPLNPWIVAVPLFIFLIALSCLAFNAVMHRVSDTVSHALTKSCQATTSLDQNSSTTEPDKGTDKSKREPKPEKSDGGKGRADPPTPTAACLNEQVKALSVLAALCGALGALLHAIGSLVAHLGAERFNPSWALWYIAQPLRGALLAAGASWLIQIGQFAQKGVGDTPVGLMGITFLIGLFSNPAIEKLRDLFGVIFQTASSSQKGAGSVGIRKPAIADVKFTGNAPQARMTIIGTSFDPKDEVWLEGKPYPTTKQSATSIELDVPPGLNVVGTSIKVSVIPVEGNAPPSNSHVAKVP